MLAEDCIVVLGLEQSADFWSLPQDHTAVLKQLQCGSGAQTDNQWTASPRHRLLVPSFQLADGGGSQVPLVLVSSNGTLRL